VVSLIATGRWGDFEAKVKEEAKTKASAAPGVPPPILAVDPSITGPIDEQTKTSGASAKRLDDSPISAMQAPTPTSVVAQGNSPTISGATNYTVPADHPLYALSRFVADLVFNENSAPEKIKSAGLKAGNPFTLAFALEALCTACEHLNSSNNLETSLADKATEWIAQARQLLRRLLEADSSPETRTEQITKGNDDAWAEKGSAHIPRFRPTTFLTQLVVRALMRKGPAEADQPSPKEALGDSYPSVIAWSRMQILHELALINANSRSADPLALIYGVVILATCVPPSKFTLDDTRIVSTAIDAFFRAQMSDGGWPSSRPLHFYEGIGNAYCYDFEVLTQLLQTEGIGEFVAPHLRSLAKTLRWAQSTAIVDKTGRFWSSGHHPHLPSAESWSTASVYHFVYSLDRFLAEQIRVFAFAHIGVSYRPPGKDAPPLKDLDDLLAGLLDSVVTIDDQPSTLKTVVRERFLEKVKEHRGVVRAGGGIPKSTPISGIFFGPPGTSKSQLAGIVAKYLDWPMLSIDPSHVVRRGLDLVQAETNQLFSMLSIMEQTVVFLDEFDELVRERTKEGSDIRSRFFTTAMLPKLTSINDSRRVIFLLATNNLKEFDFAIRRPGRFDMVLQVMPPSWLFKKENPPWKDVGEKIFEILKPLKAEERNEIETALDNLLFLEFKTLVADIRANDGEDQHALINRIKRAGDRGTLMQVLEDGDSKKVTWKERCTEESPLARII
jgi:hypothetical protein